MALFKSRDDPSKNKQSSHPHERTSSVNSGGDSKSSQDEKGQELTMNKGWFSRLRENFIHKLEKDKDKDDKNKEEREPTPEELKKREKHKQKVKLIIRISIASVIVMLAATGGLIYRYYQVTDKDIQNCIYNFKTENYPKSFKYCYKARYQEDSEIWYALGYMYEHNSLLPEKYQTANASKLAVEYYHKAAAGNSLKAQQRLGYGYLDGTALTPADEELAIKWLRRAAQQNDPKATEKLTELLLKHKMYAEAIEWLKKMAEEDNPEASYNLASLYSEGKLVGADYKQAFLYAQKSARQLNPDAEHLLALLYLSGLGTSQNPDLAFHYEKLAAAHHHTEAAYQTGFMLETGMGTEINTQEALEYYRAASTRGHAEAEYRIGFFYEKGITVNSDLRGAFHWYEKAAMHGSSNAQLALGRMYEKGQGTLSDQSEAVKMYRKAADNGNLEACYRLGRAYHRGIGISSNHQKAAEYLIKAASHNYTPAEFEMGLMKYQQKKYEEASVWFKKAMGHGHAFSAGYLGVMAARGQGCKLSNYMAYFYFLISYQLYHDPTTLDNMKLSRGNLSREQQNAAESRARKYLKHLDAFDAGPENLLEETL